MQAIGRLVRSSSRLSGGSESRSDSPWDATTARERQETAESQLSHWRQRARNAEKELEIARAAMKLQQDVRGQIPKGHSDMYDEGRVLREKMRRNHSSNRAELSVIALAGGKAFRTTCGQACSRRRGFVASSRAYSRRTGASAPSTSPRTRTVPRNSSWTR